MSICVIFIFFLLILIVIFNSVNMPNKEGYEQNDAFFRKDTSVYDKLYGIFLLFLIFGLLYMQWNSIYISDYLFHRKEFFKSSRV
jgi:hypothetical protein